MVAVSCDDGAAGTIIVGESIIFGWKSSSEGDVLIYIRIYFTNYIHFYRRIETVLDDFTL